MLGHMDIANEWGIMPSEWWAISKEDKILMIAKTRGMSNIRAMMQYDDNKKREREAKTREAKNRSKGRKR